MSAIQQGWIHCADGFSWLQRSTVLGLISSEGMTVDVTGLPGLPDENGEWKVYLADDGWYRHVPARLVSELSARHGGVVQVMSSRPDIAELPDRPVSPL